MDPDTDDDGVKDGDEEAGTVASFDGTTLVIDLAAGGSVRGRVTDATEVECEAEDHGDGDRGGRGDGGDDRGDDAGDDENEDACGTEALVRGARVHEAELDVTSAGAVFEEVELIR
jgi:hypothetical protein